MPEALLPIAIARRVPETDEDKLSVGWADLAAGEDPTLRIGKSKTHQVVLWYGQAHAASSWITGQPVLASA